MVQMAVTTLFYIKENIYIKKKIHNLSSPILCRLLLALFLWYLNTSQVFRRCMNNRIMQNRCMWGNNAIVSIVEGTILYFNLCPEGKLCL